MNIRSEGTRELEILLYGSEGLFLISLGGPHLFDIRGQGEFFVRTSSQIVNHLRVAEYDHPFSFQCNLEWCTAVLEGTIRHNQLVHNDEQRVFSFTFL